MATERTKQAVAFGEVLTERRRAAGLAQDALAEKADWERTFIAFMERGERQPTISTIIVLAAALGVDADEMVRLTVNRLD